MQICPANFIAITACFTAGLHLPSTSDILSSLYCFSPPQIKMEVLPPQKQKFLLINSPVSAQVGHHQVILKEYTNGDGTQLNWNTILQ
jgi:hypothetical protein